MEKNTTIAFKNLTALGLVQITNYVLPLLTLPYLTRVLGIEKFGLFNFGFAILLYLVIIPDFGFNITSSRKITTVKANQNLLNVSVTNTLLAKTILLLIAFGILLILWVLFPIFKQEQKLFFFGFSIVIAQTYFPMWFFQGIEQLKFIALLNLISRITLTALIFIIIQKPEDYVYVIPIYAIGMLVSAAAGLWLMFFNFNVRLTFKQWKNIFTEIKDGLPIFISSLATTTYSNVGILLMGTFGTQLQSGYYAVADKVLLVFRQLMVVVAQALYPTFYRMREQGKEKLRSILKDVSIPLFAITTVGCLIMFLFPSFIVIVLTGDAIEEITSLIQFASVIPLIMLTNTLANQLLLANNKTKISMMIILVFAFICAALGLINVYFFGSKGMILAFLLTEIFMFGSYILIIKKLGV